MRRGIRTFVADFETTVYDGQTATEVWAAALVELNSENVSVDRSIDEFWERVIELNSNCVIYFHNLKFDGAFLLSFFLRDMGYKQAFISYNDEGTEGAFYERKNLNNNELIYNISDKGQWYTITVKANNKIVEFRDSLKLLPFSVKKIGESFGTRHKKLDMEYTGYRYAGCTITEGEERYIKNDVLVVKEALEIMYEAGHTKLTIGACCLSEYKEGYAKIDYEKRFPNLYEVSIDESSYGVANAGEYVRRSYRGGWCYLVPGKAGRVLGAGCTADVNSLYPSMMSSESGNFYPVGKPTFWTGNYIPNEANQRNKYFFVRFKTKFKIKPGFLPFIQIKNSYSYRGNVSLETSDFFNEKNGSYYEYWRDDLGNLHDTSVILTMTQTDYQLMLEHYDLKQFQILDGCYFDAARGIFDEYMEKYKHIKLHSKGAKRELAKLFLNNLYGKMAASTDSSFKKCYIKPDGSLGYISIHASEKPPGYIPVGSAITSYARNFTIRAAQKNFRGAGAPGFVYADTDSIHCDMPPEKVQGIKIDPQAFCCWKMESEWDNGIFVRQKTYIERVVAEDGEATQPYYNVKCAGMPEKCKKLFIASLDPEATLQGHENEYKQNEIDFIRKRRKLTDFKVGLQVPGKLMPKNIPGGVILTETTYEMRPI